MSYQPSESLDASGQSLSHVYEPSLGSDPASAPLLAPVLPRQRGQVMRGLFKQYRKVLINPGVQTFAEEMQKAERGMIWLQIIFASLIIYLGGILGVAVGIAETYVAVSDGDPNPLDTPALFLTDVFHELLGFFFVGDGLFLIIGFACIVGMQYLLAKILGGKGKFKHQVYSHLLFYTPLLLLGAISFSIPFLLYFSFPAFLAYQVVLNAFSIMATHQMSGKRAISVVLVSFALALPLVYLLFFLTQFIPFLN